MCRISYRARVADAISRIALWAALLVALLGLARRAKGQEMPGSSLYTVHRTAFGNYVVEQPPVGPTRTYWVWTSAAGLTYLYRSDGRTTVVQQLTDRLYRSTDYLPPGYLPPGAAWRPVPACGPAFARSSRALPALGLAPALGLPVPAVPCVPVPAPFLAPCLPALRQPVRRSPIAVPYYLR